MPKVGEKGNNDDHIRYLLPGVGFSKACHNGLTAAAQTHSEGSPLPSGDWDRAALIGLENSPAGITLQRHNSKGLLTCALASLV